MEQASRVNSFLLATSDKMAGRAHPSSAARPKRQGEEFARTHDDTTKKPRFDYRNPSTLAADAPEEDVILDADVIGKSGNQTKRNAVNIDGYESDSDNDNFNERAAERAQRNEGPKKGQSSKDEEDDDMFADLEEDMQGTADGDDDEDLAREGKSSKKDVRFLDADEIEGQVANSKSGGHVSADLLQNGKQRERAGSVGSESSSGDEEERDMIPEEMDDELAAEIGAGGKKKHAPRLDAFNLKDEEEEGRFDESGNFVRKAMDPDAANDTWLDGLSKKDLKRAKEAEEKREEERRRKAMESDAVLASDSLSTLLLHLETGETPLEALQRLGRSTSTSQMVLATQIPSKSHANRPWKPSLAPQTPSTHANNMRSTRRNESCYFVNTSVKRAKTGKLPYLKIQPWTVLDMTHMARCGNTDGATSETAERVMGHTTGRL
jgi:CD2 antigen cytoplasmic tail-binding protein 2